MSIEQPARMPTEEEVRVVGAKLDAFIAEDAESAGLNYSETEMRLATKFLAARLVSSGKSAEDVDGDMIRRALEARRDVRGSERIPVLDSQGMVIGTAGSPEEAKKMAQRENEARDLS